MTQLLPHQIETAQFLSHAKGIAGCFSGMGSGKTLAALEAVRSVSRGYTPVRLLVIAPPIALRMWAQEAEGWLHGFNAQILKTGTTKIRYGDHSDRADVLVCSYQIATTRAPELKAWLAEPAFEGIVICDESHALKNSRAKRTKAILGSAGVVRSADYAWMLTGTPVTRWNDDLFAFLANADKDGMMTRCGGSRLSLERFQLRYTVRQQKVWPGARFPVWVTVGNARTDELNAWLYDGDHAVAIRHELKDVWAAMPDLVHRVYTIRGDTSCLDAADRATLASFGKHSRSALQGMLQGGGTDADDVPLSTVRRLLGRTKIKATVEELLDRVDRGDTPILVGAWHTEVIDALTNALRAKGAKVASLDGRTSAARKGDLEDQFNAGQLDVLVGQISAMGVSLNLQKGGAHQIVVIEDDWSPSIMDQFYARLLRMGQRNHVQVDTIRTDHPLDEAVADLAARKRREHARLNTQSEEMTR